jgi:hypothetical protein
MFIRKIMYLFSIFIFFNYINISNSISNGFSSSSGKMEVRINIHKPASIKAANVSDYSIGHQVKYNSQENRNNFCIQSDIGSQYKITASSANGDGSFTMNNGNKKLDYAISWDDSINNNVYLTSNTQSVAFDGAQKSCADGNNATLSIKAIGSANHNNKNFTDILTLTITPV